MSIDLPLTKTHAKSVTISGKISCLFHKLRLHVIAAVNG